MDCRQPRHPAVTVKCASRLSMPMFLVHDLVVASSTYTKYCADLIETSAKVALRLAISRVVSVAPRHARYGSVEEWTH